ncbi:MAG: hypothetical protein LBV00_12130 [Propionibacteriaceae bacterium]|jgi:hypothetical protein|nr:hypothetical protein [Propionibacteriaceae bacterium]
MNKDTSQLSPDETLDPAEALRLYADETERAKHSDVAITRLNLAAWGVAWLIGYGALYLGAQQTQNMPPAWAFIVFNLMIIAAVVVSAIAGIRQGTRTIGPSRMAGAMWGWSWFIGFVAGTSMIGIVAARYTLDGEVLGLLMNSMAALLVGVLYTTGGAVFKQWSMFIIGTAFVALALAGVLVGLPLGYLVMALVGGGIMLASVVVVTIWSSKARS